MNKGKKRIFILLGMATVLLYCLVFAVIWLIMTSESAFWRHVSDWFDGSLCGADAANGAGIELSGIWVCCAGPNPRRCKNWAAIL